MATPKSKIITKLSWQVVCGEYEMQSFQQYQVVRNYRWADTRNEVFDRMKWPNHTIWSGGWGKEPLYWPKEQDPVMGRLGIVWATDRRANEIREWIQDQMKTKK